MFNLINIHRLFFYIKISRTIVFFLYLLILCVLILIYSNREILNMIFAFSPVLNFNFTNSITILSLIL